MEQLFAKKILEIVKLVPKGKVTTYQGIARIAGNERAYRAAGNALHQNKYPIVIPCHRVVCSNGYIGGYGGGVRKKKKILTSEGIIIKKEKIDLKKFGWKI
ncbi:MGMT family protein [Candidatus Parcubacteria bacterium]|nr:MAG: MGMT family protein [Candidatus Parcubacteria bacterium]